MPPEDRDGFANVSVIIPAYRAAATIGRALASVSRQTLKPKEVIVVDDGSDDGTRETAEAWGEQMNGVALTVFRQDNAGAGAARNRAIAGSTGRYLAFLDADDEWLSEKLARCLSAMEDGNLDFLCHNAIFVTLEGKEILLDSQRTYRRFGDPYLACFQRGFISTPTVVTRRDTVIYVGGFDPTLESGQDVDLWLSILSLADVRVGVLADALAKYHESPKGITQQVGLRTDCARRIVRTHAHELVGRVSAPYLIVLYRALIIDYQAFWGHVKRRRFGGALCALVAAPWYALTLPFAGWRERRRPDFLKAVLRPE